MTAPNLLQQQFSTIPEELRQYPQWVAWQLVQKPGKPKPDKIPVNPLTHEWASVSNHETWSTYEAALAACMQYPEVYQGIGFVFTEEDPFAFIDLDHVKDGNQWNPVLQETLKNIPSWSEFSQSGEGVHIIAKAEGPSAKTQGLECYQYGRFVALTGKHIPDTPDTINDCQVGVDWFREQIRIHGGSEEKPPSRAPDNPVQASLERLGFSFRVKDHGAKLELDYCPWHHEHSTGPGGAVFMLAHHNGRPHDAFFCQHASCQGRNLKDLTDYLASADAVFSAAQAKVTLPFNVVRDGVDPHAVQKPESLFISASECVVEARKPIDWLVRGLMESGQVGLMYGDSGTYKSYMALDLSVHMILGWEWHGLKTKQAPVWYLAGEGNAVMNRRIECLRQHHGLHEEHLRKLYMSRMGHNIMQEGWIHALNDQLAATSHEPPGLIVIDTMSRNAIMDENSARDVGEFVDRCALLAQYWNTTVLIVHHTGKDKNSGARGSYALQANTDFRYRIEKQVHPGEVMTGLTVEKLKGAPEPEDPLVFIAKRKPVLGLTDESGEVYHDMVLAPYDSTSFSGKTVTAFSLKPTDRELLQVFWSIYQQLPDYDAAVGVHLDDVFELYKRYQVNNGKKPRRANFNRTFYPLVNNHYLRTEESNGETYVLPGAKR